MDRQHAQGHTSPSLSAPWMGLFGTRALLGLALVALLAFASVAQAVDSFSAAPLGSRSTFSQMRDPLEFAKTITEDLQRPMVSLSRTDAVATEVMRRTKSLDAGEALAVARVLCEEGDRLGFDPLYLLAVIHIESYYNHLALSPVGAEGLMQLMPPTAAWTAERSDLVWGDNHSFDPELNVRLGSRYLAHLHEQFDDRAELALTAYNRGPSATRHIVRKYGALPASVRDFYATKVLDRYRKLRRIYGHLPQG